MLYTLYDRSHFDDNEYLILIAPMYEARNVSLLRTLYEWSIVGVENMHSPKYAISKKFSEVSFPRLDEFQSDICSQLSRVFAFRLTRLLQWRFGLKLTRSR